MEHSSDSNSLHRALKDAELGAVKTGEDAQVEEVLACAKVEINAPALQHLWDDATECHSSADRLFRTVYSRAQRRMGEKMNIQYPVDGQVVGHALVQAAQGGYLHVVRILRKGQLELAVSVLASRFMAFALLKAVETGRSEVVHELLRSTSLAGLALMGHELAGIKDDDYPFVKVNMTKNWSRRLAATKALLPPATQSLQLGSLELRGSRSEQEAVHDATRACYCIYVIWRLLLVAAANSHGAVFREILRRRDEQNNHAGEGWKVASGLDLARVQDLMRLRSRIDDDFAKLVMKITAKLERDTLLYDIWSRTDATQNRQGKEVEGDSPWKCQAKAQFGVWEVMMEVPTLLMEIEGSYKEDKRIMRRYKYVKPLLPQMAKIDVQFKLSIEIGPNYIEVVVGIQHVRVFVENSLWEEGRTGHFPSRISLSVTPTTAGGTSVSMTGSSTNTSYKVGTGETIRAGFHANIKAAPGGGFGFAAGKSISSKVEGKPWKMEQLPVYGERGGSFIWTLSNLRGTGFDRLNPMIMAAKSSIWQLGRRVPLNPLFQLPFGSNGGVNFTESEFSDTLAWRFPKDLENTDVVFNIEGQVHTTYITPSTFWETRVVPFEAKVAQKMEACGDPAGGDKKKKKKKK